MLQGSITSLGLGFVEGAAQQQLILDAAESFIAMNQGKIIGGCIIVPLTSCFTGLDMSVLQIKTKIVSSHTANS